MSIDAVGSTVIHTSAWLMQAGKGQRTSAPTRLDLPPLELPPLELPTRESLARDTASFAADVRAAFREAGIGVPPEAVLGNDSDGHVRVANGHPDKARIERMFEDNPELRDRYSKISAQSSLLRAAANHSRFVAEYDRLEGNFAAQKALVESTVSRNKAPFFLGITADGAEPFFSENVSV